MRLFAMVPTDATKRSGRALRRPASQARYRRGVSASLVLPLALLVLASTALPMTLHADPNKFDQQRIEAAALDAFHKVLSMWREEVYFELFANGTLESQLRLGQEGFAQRMVELSWVPDGIPNPKYQTTEFRHRTMVFIKVRIPYRNKFNPDKRFSKDQVLLMQQEGGTWRVDLVQLVRAPFE
ncbi:MAG: hypothetical protein OEW39_10335 [Deltaproteobacteria bacterium]|nr:hypothetical protein [Deltaproteobacteria bacterium]